MPSLHLFRATLILPLLLGAGRLDAQATGDSLARQVSAGDSAWALGARAVARGHYASAAGRTAVPTHVLYRLALLETEENRLAPAIALLREYVRREPRDGEGRLTLARTLAWDGKYLDALQLYDAVLLGDSTWRDAAHGRAQVLSWMGRHDAAVAAWRQWLAGHSADTEAALGLAQALAWGGALAAAESTYSDIAARTSSREAARGAARVRGWRGDLGDAQRRWQALVQADSNDVESLVGLAQVLRWQGESRAADRVVRRGLALRPDHRDGRQLAAALRPELSGAVQPSMQRLTDSDGNALATTALAWRSAGAGAMPVRIGVMHRVATLATQRAQATSARLSTLWASSARRVTLSAEAGATRLSGGDAPERVRPVGTARLGLRPQRRVSGGVSWSLAPFDETAPLIASGVVLRGLDADAEWALPGALSLATWGGRTTVSGGAHPNTRVAGGGVLRWTVRPAFTAAATVRAMQWDTTGRADGYFAPAAFTLREVAAQWSPGGEQGWGAVVEAGMGQQAIRFVDDTPVTHSRAVRGNVVLRWAPRAGDRLELVAGLSTAASAVTQTTEYSARWLGLRGRLRAF